MNTIKYLLIVVLVLGLSSFSHGDRKEYREVKKTPIEELNNPESPSYVPCPYPKNREEVITNLKYAVKLLWEGRADSPFRKVMVDLLNKNSEYKIGRVVKLKAQSAYNADDYNWLILIRDKKNEVIARVTMRAEGHVGSGMHTAWAAANCKQDFPNSPRRGPHHFVTKKDVLLFLNHALERPVNMDEIKTMERITFYGYLGNGFVPSWEITFKDGTVLYYSEARHTVYKIGQRVPCGTTKAKGRPHVLNLIPPSRKGKRPEYFLDTLHDELIFFDAVKRLEVDF